MMGQKLPASFMRGGTSKAIMFHARDLPEDRARWDAIFLAAMGSPDPNGRQLDGMGGGVSSLSKVCIIGEPSRPDADVDYTFAQIQIGRARVDYSSNCGNMSSAVGPFAVDEGLVRVEGDEAVVRIHNTNTNKIILGRFPVCDGKAVEAGTMQIPGVSGSGAPIGLEFLDPGGASTGSLLPTGRVTDVLRPEGLDAVEVSMVDAANACVFVPASAVGLTGTELPDELDANPAVLNKLALIREAASVAMGITSDLAAAKLRGVPFVVMVGAPADAKTLTGETIQAADADLCVRAISSGQPHRALPLTVSLCIAVAASLPDSIVHRLCRPIENRPLRLATPSGVLDVGAEVVQQDGEWTARRGIFFRTARRLFDGFVYF